MSVKLYNTTDGITYTHQDDGIIATTGGPATLRAQVLRLAKARTRADLHGVADVPVWVWPPEGPPSPEQLKTLPKTAQDEQEGARGLTPYQASIRANRALVAAFERYDEARHGVVLQGTRKTDAAIKAAVVSPMVNAAAKASEGDAQAKATLAGLTAGATVASPLPATASLPLTPPPAPK